MDTLSDGVESNRELLWALCRLVAQIGQVGMDVVGVAPVTDAELHISCFVAHRCGTEAMTRLWMRKLGIADPDHLNPGAAAGPEPPDYSVNEAMKGAPAASQPWACLL